MASTNHTEHLNLNQWVGTDPVLMADFNADNAKIDAAIAALPRCATGSYTGTDTYGSEHPNTLTFDFAPKLVIVLGGECCCIFFAGCADGIGIRVGSGGNHLRQSAAWSGNSLSWYAAAAVNGEGSYAISEREQLNEGSTVYRWFAIG